MKVSSGEILFVKSVKDGIPNRDPLQDSDVRRIFPEEDGRISLTDVSIKRDVRDYVITSEYDGGNNKNNYVFAQEVFNEKGNLLGRGSLAKLIAEKVDKGKEASNDMKPVLVEHCFDVRTFGIVYSVKPKFNLTGPVQFGWAHSMHPVDSQYVQGTVVIPSADIKDGGEGKTQGTIWSSYIVPFAVFSMPGVINAKNAELSKMTVADQELLLKGLWQGTLHRQARGRGQQQPLFLLHIEYKDPFFRIGYIEDLIKLEPGEEVWKGGGKKPSSLNDIGFNISSLLGAIEKNQDKIKACKVWCDPRLNVNESIEKYKQELW
jgi:CRISPR-associated protein Csh2